MTSHEEKILRISKQLRQRQGYEPLSIKKKAVSHEVPKASDQQHLNERIDISDLTDIISIDEAAMICIAESGVTYLDLVRATLEHDLVPIVVPELKTITIGGAVTGCSIESMSYKYGGFHDTCLEYEVVIAGGEVLTCTPDNENALIFQMMHGSFGTLGILTKLKFKLVPAQPFVRMEFFKFDNLAAYQAAISDHYTRQDTDFMDGIIFSPNEYLLSLGNFISSAPYLRDYNWLRVCCQDSRHRKENYVKTIDYFFRYDHGVTNSTPSSWLGRLLLGKFIGSAEVLGLVRKLRGLIPEKMIPVTVDTFIPFSRTREFLGWYNQEINFYPLWCVPYKLARKYEWLAQDFAADIKDELFLDIAIYGLPKNPAKNYYKLLEDELMGIGAIKTLISTNYYQEDDFWKIFNKPNYYQAKRLVDPNNIFQDLYKKKCRPIF